MSSKLDCYFPYKDILIDVPRNEIKWCCKLLEGSSLDNHNPDSPETDPLLMDIRNSLAAGVEHSACDNCWRAEHKQIKSWRQTEGKVTHFFTGVGTGGTITGIGAFLKEKNPDVKIIGCQPQQNHLIQGWRNFEESAKPDLFLKRENVVDDWVSVDNEEAFSVVKDVFEKDQLLISPSSAAVYACMKKYPIEGDACVVGIFADDGSLISGPNLVFDVLPSLFDGMGSIGLFVGFGFFILMSIAALTSSISMLEGPVSFAVERHNIERKKATTIIGLGILSLSTLIVFNFETLFGLVISISTVYGQPLIAMLCCVFVGWIWQRSLVLAEIKEGCSEVEHTLFWKIWPWYTKFICPSAIAIVFWHSL